MPILEFHVASDAIVVQYHLTTGQTVVRSAAGHSDLGVVPYEVIQRGVAAGALIPGPEAPQLPTAGAWSDGGQSLAGAPGRDRLRLLP
jgi:hypothetical protein